jgi:hypothetical protein
MNWFPLRILYTGVACMVLLAIAACVPVQAADPIPTAESLFPLNQAHLAWMAEIADVEMVASITYVDTLIGKNTSTMLSLHDDFRNARLAVSSIASRPALVTQTSLMQKTVLLFNQETKNQIAAHQGNTGGLQVQIHNALNAADSTVALKKDAYWAIRSARQLDDFDSWVIRTQKTLDTLQTRGYPVTDAQLYLNRFTGLRTDLKSSLDAQDLNNADVTALTIRGRSLEISDRITALQEQVPENTTAEFRIGEADRVIIRADWINNQLVEQILDIGAAEPVLSRTKNDVNLARSALKGGQAGIVSTQLQLIKKDYRDLAAAYRDIAISASLPEGMAEVLKTTRIALEDTADRIGEP